MNVAAARAAMLRLVPPPPAAPPAAAAAPVPDPPPAAPPAAAAPPALVSVPPAPTATPRGWARYAGSLGSGVAVALIGDSLRNQKPPLKPNEPDDADVRYLENAIAIGLTENFGDGPKPWWLDIGLGLCGIYAGMRIGAKRQTSETARVVDAAAAQVPTSSSSPAPPRPRDPEPAPANDGPRFEAPPPLSPSGALAVKT